VTECGFVTFQSSSGPREPDVCTTSSSLLKRSSFNPRPALASRTSSKPRSSCCGPSLFQSSSGPREPDVEQEIMRRKSDKQFQSSSGPREPDVLDLQMLSPDASEFQSSSGPREPDVARTGTPKC